MTSNLREFNAELLRLSKEMPENEISKLHRAIHLDALDRIDAKSPRDTGRFANSHQTTVNGNPPEDDLPEDAWMGRDSVAEGSSELISLKPFSVSHISSNVPYAEPLENGHSKQRPEGVYGVTFSELRQTYGD